MKTIEPLPSLLILQIKQKIASCVLHTAAGRMYNDYYYVSVPETISQFLLKNVQIFMHKKTYTYVLDNEVPFVTTPNSSTKDFFYEQKKRIVNLLFPHKKENIFACTNNVILCCSSFAASIFEFDFTHYRKLPITQVFRPQDKNEYEILLLKIVRGYCMQSTFFPIESTQ